MGCRLTERDLETYQDTEQIRTRAIATMIMVNHQRIKLMSVRFSHSGNADHHIEKMYRTSEKHTSSSKKGIQG